MNSDLFLTGVDELEVIAVFYCEDDEQWFTLNLKDGDSRATIFITMEQLTDIILKATGAVAQVNRSRRAAIGAE